MYPRKITTDWKKKYDLVLFRLPQHAEMDRVNIEAEEQVKPGQQINITVALASPRGRPIKNAGKMLKKWYERGTKYSKQKFTCSLCHINGHSARTCVHIQMFDDSEVVTGE